MIFHCIAIGKHREYWLQFKTQWTLTAVGFGTLVSQHRLAFIPVKRNLIELFISSIFYNFNRYWLALNHFQNVLIDKFERKNIIRQYLNTWIFVQYWVKKKCCCRSRVSCITPTNIKYLIYMIRVLSRPIKISRIVNRNRRVNKLYPTRTARIWRFTIADTATETHEDLQHNSGRDVQYNFCVFLSALRHLIKWTVFSHHHDGRFCVLSVDLR